MNPTRLLPLLFLFLGSLFATAQFPDRLLIDKEEHAIFCNPLDQFFAKNPERRPKSEGMCTALWRGYIGVFVIKDKQLSVSDVLVLNPNSNALDFVSRMGDSFPLGTDRTLTWFTGLLVLPQGEQLEYVHMGYASLYERYRLIHIKAGKVVADRTFTSDEYREYRLLQWEEYKKTQDYKTMLADLKKREPSELEAEKFLAIYSVNFQSDIALDYKDFTPSKAK